MDILFLSSRLFLGENDGPDFINGGIIVTTEGKIRKILRGAGEVNSYVYTHESEAVFDFEDKVLMPGLIDVNVHISEPGRNDWEGFSCATKAAAAGGITTILDRPQYSVPFTTSLENLKCKVTTARGKLFVDVGFWGGLIDNNSKDIEKMVQSGVMGIQCSMCPLEDFPATSSEEIEKVLPLLDDHILAVHTELPLQKPINPNPLEPKMYKTFLDTRPESMEINAVKQICKIAENHTKTKFHIMNLSSSKTLTLMEASKKKGANISVETCPHYLFFNAESIPELRTEFKCLPPIRTSPNNDNLWEAIKTKQIDIISSNHCPCTNSAKCLSFGKNRGNFIDAFPGVSSLQFSLPAFWTKAREHGLGIRDVYRLLCANPAKLCGIDSFKGKIKEDYDADFCIWDPEVEFKVTPDINHSQNKPNPYMDMTLYGRVHATVVRGLHVYQLDEGFGQPLGKVVQRKSFKKIVKFC
ncbi:hypothetical protein ACFFRR_001444 [Megaselia abdita]